MTHGEYLLAGSDPGCQLIPLQRHTVGIRRWRAQKRDQLFGFVRCPEHSVFQQRAGANCRQCAEKFTPAGIQMHNRTSQLDLSHYDPVCMIHHSQLVDNAIRTNWAWPQCHLVLAGQTSTGLSRHSEFTQGVALGARAAKTKAPVRERTPRRRLKPPHK